MKILNTKVAKYLNKKILIITQLYGCFYDNNSTM